jgi:hypothetical protein
MNKILIIMLCLFFSNLATSAIECGAEKWVKDPVVKNGMFLGYLEADCLFTDVKGDVRKLDEYFLKAAIAGAEVIHDGPTPIIFENLPSHKVEVTVRNNQGTMKNSVTIGSDSLDKFIYMCRTKEIHFSGFAGYLDYLDIQVRVTRLSDHSFKLTLFNETHVRKPQMAPAGIFLNMAIKNSLQEFRSNLTNMANEVSRNF